MKMDLQPLDQERMDQIHKQSAPGYAYDPFAGLEAIQSSAMSDGEAIVGDLSAIQANLPEGDSVKFKFDDLSLAEKDLVKIVGRLYVAMAIVVPNMVARIVPES